MKDQYVGDINDLVKYALLRALVAPSERLGVVWMLTPKDGRQDGGRTGYLKAPGRYRDIDPDVFDVLDQALAAQPRGVASIESSSLFANAVFVSDLLPDGADARGAYFERAANAVADCDVVFFDPDNGLGVKSVRRGNRNSSKYLYIDELTASYSRGHSVVVYQHFPRRPRRDLLDEMAHQLLPATNGSAVVAVYTASVAFLTIPQPHAAEWIAPRLRAFTERTDCGIEFFP